MKVVLDTKKGSGYDDAIASHYHFPSRYLRHVSAAVGDWAVFRRPRDGGEGISYFGVGEIVNVTADPKMSGHHYAQIANYLTFPTPVPWKPEGSYAERALRGIAKVPEVGVYLRGRSVRPLESEDFVRIVEVGMSELVDPANRRRYWDDAIPEISDQLDTPDGRVRQLTSRTVRDASFRKLVCEAYDDRCAVTRLRIVNGGGRSEVQAAHIRSVADCGFDTVQNGIALSATAHWLFDRHLISVDPEYRLIVAHNRVPQEFRSLLEPAESKLHLPENRRLYPSQENLAFHRERFANAS